MLIKSTLLLAALLPIAALGQTCGDHFAPPAVVHGKKFFSSYSGEYLAIKGISYYPRPNEGELTVTNSIDFFTEEFRHIWERDIEHFKDLGVNAVRIYAVDPSKNHDAFMCALREAGIYAIIGLAADCESEFRTIAWAIENTRLSHTSQNLTVFFCSPPPTND